jgi:hypothetical protein
MAFNIYLILMHFFLNMFYTFEEPEGDLIQIGICSFNF